ncbi:ATP-binding protein [Providencia sp. PROV212]|uniref:ATP-binding protein n=1 Tax=Providencia sp. PROV212 TaxID=2949909 RepID=UPI00234BE3DA|nr:ATP-binding protein [Providencia sp. PROV212]
MSDRESYLGKVQDVNGTTVSVSLSKDSLSGFVYIDGQGYRAGQIGSFVRIPIGFNNLFGIISQVGASASPLEIDDISQANSRWLRIQLIGEAQRNGIFERGLSQYPTIGDNVHLVSEKELKQIYGQPDEGYFVKIGNISNADSIPALIDINKLITRHSAVVGTTGSGKSTTVASLISALSDPIKYPSARIIMIDLHGEYGRSLKDRANIYKINADTNPLMEEKELYIPFWALNFDELSEVCFGGVTSEKERNILLERIQKVKVESLQAQPREGANHDTLSADSPIPFNLHSLWHQLYTETFGTYIKTPDKKALESLAYETLDDGTELKGCYLSGIAPIFKNVSNEAGGTKINYLPSPLSLGKQLQVLGAKLRIPRYDFLFKPGPWSPSVDGEVEKDLDELMKGWIGEKPVTILDLSGVPSDILQTIIGAVLRILYEALFWARNLSQGGRHRPLLIVMEEAHNYLSSQNDSMASRLVKRVVKEGRKYGIGSMIVTQRPSEIDPTILSQCGTFFALRLNNSSDRSHITSAMSDNLDGLTSMLPILRTGECIVLGEAVKLPMRTSVIPPAKNRRPDSQDPIVYDTLPQEDSMNPGGWNIYPEDNPNYAEVIESWRAQSPRINKVKL